MKLRQGFVSNSSSSSFWIKLDELTGKQIRRIKNHAAKMREVDPHIPPHQVDDYAWDIEMDEDFIGGQTWMDNFDMHFFLTERLGVAEDLIKWGEWGDSPIGK